MSAKWHMFAASKAVSSMRDKAAILKFFVTRCLGPGISKTDGITLHTIWNDIWTAIRTEWNEHPTQFNLSVSADILETAGKPCERAHELPDKLSEYNIMGHRQKQNTLHRNAHII